MSEHTYKFYRTRLGYIVLFTPDYDNHTGEPTGCEHGFDAMPETPLRLRDELIELLGLPWKSWSEDPPSPDAYILIREKRPYGYLYRPMKGDAGKAWGEQLLEPRDPKWDYIILEPAPVNRD
jgi:hypothetical protein